MRIINGSHQGRRQDPRDVHGPRAPGRQARPLHAEVRSPASALRTGRCRLRHRGHQGNRWRAGGRHHHAREPAGGRAAAGLQADQAARVRGPVPDQLRRLREVPRRARRSCASTTRRCTTSRKSPRRSGFGFRCRLPRPAAHGHRAGAAGARVRARAGHQRAHGGVRSATHRRRSSSYVDNPAKLPPVERNRGDARAHHHCQHPRAARITSARC